MLKVELHSHTADDPQDYIPHTAVQLIDRAADLGYQGLAITLHDRQLDLAPLDDHARRRGVVLIPGVERTIDGRHVLLLNFPPDAGAARVRTLEGVGRLRTEAPEGLVVAPHPFYPLPSCLGKRLDRHPELFDAVEHNALYSRLIDFNARAGRWAREHHKPMVGNADVHRLDQLGYTYSLVDAGPTAAAICAAIRAGRVRVVTQPLSTPRLAWMLARLLPSGVRGRGRR